MKVKVYFSESEQNVLDFKIYLYLLDKALHSFLELSPFRKMVFDIFLEGVPDETSKEKACNKGVCKQRRHKTVNACKPS